MIVIREVMHCKPGQVRPMVEKFRALSKLMKEMGMPGMRIVTDFSGTPFWTVNAEMEAESLDGFDAMEKRVMANEEAGKIMAGYHDLVSSGRREIYRLES